jgi:hypothetical protein
MIPLRSAETQKKEFDLQAVQTTKINLELQKHTDNPDSNYREHLKDAAVFANVLRSVAPENSLVVLHYAPEIIFTTETEDFTCGIYMNGNMWRFKVNGSVHYELDDAEKLAPGRALKKMWDMIIPRLPEGYIVHGNADPNDPPEEAKIRNAMRMRLGFSDVQASGDVFGIVREGRLCPLTLDEFLALTGEEPSSLKQKFSVRKINWPGI